MFKIISTTAAVAGALAAFTGVAAAQDTVRVRYGDLDLAQAAGAAAFDQRVERAARGFCRAEPRQVHTLIRDRDCAGRTRAAIMDALPDAQRNQLAAARTGSPTVLASR